MTFALVMLWRLLGDLTSWIGNALHKVPKAVWDHLAAFTTAGLIGWMGCYIHYDVTGLRSAAANWSHAEKRAFALKDAEIVRLQKQIAMQRATDDKLTSQLDAALKQTRIDHANAAALLKKDVENNDQNSRCAFNGDARRLLDIAAGAVDGNAALPDSATAGDPAARGSSAAAPAALSCEQLVTGYLNLGEYARNTRALAIAWQDWFRANYSAGD